MTDFGMDFIVSEIKWGQKSFRLNAEVITRPEVGH
jgi:hypothetical protein